MAGGKRLNLLRFAHCSAVHRNVRFVFCFPSRGKNKNPFSFAIFSEFSFRYVLFVSAFRFSFVSEEFSRRCNLGLPTDSVIRNVGKSLRFDIHHKYNRNYTPSIGAFIWFQIILTLASRSLQRVIPVNIGSIIGNFILILFIRRMNEC